MITATATTQTSTRRKRGIDRAVTQHSSAEADAAKLDGIALAALQDPDALPGRGRWAECY